MEEQLAKIEARAGSCLSESELSKLTAVQRAEEMHKASVQKLKQMAELREKIADNYGDVYPMSIEVGVAAYTKEVVTTTEDQVLGAAEQQMQANLQTSALGKAVGAAAGAGAGTKTKDGAESGSASHISSFKFSMIGGGGAPPSDDLSSVQKQLSNPSTWRAIHLRNFVPVVDLLPKALRQKLSLYDGAEEEEQKTALKQQELNGEAFERNRARKLKEDEDASLQTELEHELQALLKFRDSTGFSGWWAMTASVQKGWADLESHMDPSKCHGVAVDNNGFVTKLEFCLILDWKVQRFACPNTAEMLCNACIS